MLAAYGRTQTVFTDTLRGIETHLTALAENDAELKRMILDQGTELRAQASQIRALNERLGPATGEKGASHDDV